MRNAILLFLGLSFVHMARSQDSTVNALFHDIAAMGHEYANLKNETNAAKIAEITKRVTIIDNRIRSSEVIGIDSILFNVHQFSTYLNYYSEFLNNPVTIPDSLKPSRVFLQVDSVARFLASFDTIRYDTEQIQELFFTNQDATAFSGSADAEPTLEGNNKGLSGIKSTSNAKVIVLSKMAGLGCCKIRIKVRVRVVVAKPKKTYDNLVKTIENAVNTVGSLIPEDVKKLGVKIFAASLEVEGQYIHFLNEVNKRIFSVSHSTFEFLRTLQENTDKELLNATSNLMNTVGLQMPAEVESLLDKMIAARSNILRETMIGFAKTMDLNFKINEMTADALKLFSKYLLLAGTEFPSMLKRPKPAISAADAYLQLNQVVLQKAINKLFAHTIDMDTAKYKGFKLLLNGSEHKISFDENSGSILVELGDFNVKGLYLLGGMADLVAPSATINIKKAKLQLVPEIAKDVANTINLRPRLYELDVKGSMPLFDRLIAWAIEKNFLENKIVPLELDSTLHDEFTLQASLPASLPVSFGTIKDFSIRDNYLTVALISAGQNEGQLSGTTIAGNGFSLELSEQLLKNLLAQALQNDGIRFSLKKDTSTERIFDPSYNYLHFKKINAFRIEETKLFVDLNTQVHFRRFLGKKPKLNFEVTHAAFYLTPQLGKNKKGETVMKLMMLPAIDKIEISKVNKRLTRKALKLFKQAKEPTLLAEVKLESLQKIKFENPFKANENLLDRFESLTLKLETGRIVINVQ